MGSIGLGPAQVELIGLEVGSEQMLRAVSLVNQNPSGTDTALQINFGSAQNTGSDPVMLAGDGTVTFNEAGSYLAIVTFSFGRTGASGASQLFGRVLINGSPVLNPVHAELENANITMPLQVRIPLFEIPAATELTFEIYRDSSGNDSGGLLADTAGLSGWGTAPSATITVFRNHTV